MFYTESCELTQATGYLAEPHYGKMIYMPEEILKTLILLILLLHTISLKLTITFDK